MKVYHYYIILIEQTTRQTNARNTSKCSNFRIPREKGMEIYYFGKHNNCREAEKNMLELRLWSSNYGIIADVVYQRVEENATNDDK